MSSRSHVLAPLPIATRTTHTLTFMINLPISHQAIHIIMVLVAHPSILPNSPMYYKTISCMFIISYAKTIDLWYQPHPYHLSLGYIFTTLSLELELVHQSRSDYRRHVSIVKYWCATENSPTLWKTPTLLGYLVVVYILF